MQIKPIQYIYYNNQQKTQFNKNTVSPVIHPKINGLSNVYYHPLSFRGETFETNIIKKAMVGMFKKMDGIFTKNGNAVDMNKITWENLTSEKLDIVTAPKKKISAYRYFLSIMESYGKNPKDSGDFASQWNEKYNPFNLDSPLAPINYLAKKDIKENVFAPNRALLKNPNKCKSLDVPVFDNEGNLNINGVFIDTETTGTKVESDRILQIGAIVMKKGKIAKVYDQLVNPEMHIPEGATGVNGISDEMVSDAPKMKDIIKDFSQDIMSPNNGVIITWNGVKFDVPLINRITREIRGEEGITIGSKLDKVVNETPMHNVLDIQILHQRLHPFVGSSKQLGKQYHWLFCRPMDDAHKALSDVKGMMPIFEYDMRLLNSLRVDKSKPLTLRQVMLFQNGEPDVPNLNIHLDPNRGFNTKVKYYPSYKREPIDYEHYFSRYNLSSDVIDSLEPQIGSENVNKFYDADIVDAVIDENYKGNPIQAAETKKIPGTGKKKYLAYEMRQNLEKLFDIAGIEGYKKKSQKEIRELIAQKSMQFISTSDDGMEAEKLARGRWVKNVDPSDIAIGNDLPNDDIAKEAFKADRKRFLDWKKAA